MGLRLSLAVATLGLGLACVALRAAPGRAAAEEGAAALRGLRRAPQLGLQLDDPVLRGVEGLVGDDGVLDEEVGRVRVGPQRAVDHVRRLGVLQPAAGLAEVLQEAAEEVAFIGRHGAGCSEDRGETIGL